MKGFQNKTDILSFFVSQLGCFIDFKINTSTRRCGRVGVTSAADLCNYQSRQITICTPLQSQSTKIRNSRIFKSRRKLPYLLTCNVNRYCLLACQYMSTSANRLSLGTEYCITFTPPFVSEDFNKLNTPSFEGALYIEIVVFIFKSLIFILFYLYEGFYNFKHQHCPHLVLFII